MFRGVKTVYFVFTSATNVQFDAWQFTKQDPDAVALPTSGTPSTVATYDLSGRRLTTPHPRQGIVIEQYIDGNGAKRSRKVH